MSIRFLCARNQFKSYQIFSIQDRDFHKILCRVCWDSNLRHQRFAGGEGGKIEGEGYTYALTFVEICIFIIVSSAGLASVALFPMRTVNYILGGTNISVHYLALVSFLSSLPLPPVKLWLKEKTLHPLQPAVLPINLLATDFYMLK